MVRFQKACNETILTTICSTWFITCNSRSSYAWTQLATICEWVHTTQSTYCSERSIRYPNDVHFHQWTITNITNETYVQRNSILRGSCYNCLEILHGTLLWTRRISSNCGYANSYEPWKTSPITITIPYAQIYIPISSICEIPAQISQIPFTIIL